MSHSAPTVSPEFRLRPSLSGDDSRRARVREIRVAGVQTPAFVERTWISALVPPPWTVSPEFRLRPSLSGPDDVGRGHAPDVSPEFRLRPSLSGSWQGRPLRDDPRVSPEFRLRPSLSVLHGRSGR